MITIKHFFLFWTDIPATCVFPSFGSKHIRAMFVIAVCIISALLFIKRLSKKTARRIIYAAAIIEPILEVLRIIWLYSVGQTDIIKLLPLHLCTMQMFFVPLAVFTYSKVLREFMFFSAIIGGISAIVFPVGVADTYPFFHFQTLQTLAVHSLLIFIPLALLLFDDYYPNIKNLPNILLIFFITIIPAALVDFVFGENYMFLNTAPVGTPMEHIYNAFGHTGYLLFFFLFLCIFVLVLYFPFELNRKKEALQTENNHVSCH